MPRKKILLVDDSATILMMEKFILRNDPYEVLTAANGEEAIEKAIAGQPDLILLDAVMPRMSGLEVLDAMRSDTRTRHIPIILVITPGHAAANGTDVLAKPINAMELLGKVRTYLFPVDKGETQ